MHTCVSRRFPIPLEFHTRMTRIKVGFGHDSHRFVASSVEKPLRLGGVIIPDAPGLEGNSDADVVLHALGRAIDSVTGVPVIGPVSDALCRQGITDSRAYVRASLEHLPTGARITHVAISIEGSRPRLRPWIEAMRQSIADILQIPSSDVGVTVTSGEALTPFGRGEGLQVWAVVTVVMV